MRHASGIGLCTLAIIAGSGVAPVSAQVNWDSYRVEAVLVEEGPTLDGVLDERIWNQATLIDQFVQQEPLEGEPASERTEVRVLYDTRMLYIGLQAFDATPGGAQATEMRRDSERVLQEDNFQIILDTFMDSRSAYMFVTNPLGAQLDQQVFNEGEGGRPGMPSTNINRDWDAIWDVSARRTSEGWNAEIAIPLSTLRFPDGDEQRWGINFMRNIGRKNEQALWAPIPKAYTITRVSMAGSLNGLQSVSSGSDLRITPFVTGGARRISDDGDVANSTESDAGIDLRYGVTPGLNLDLTFNTDFAQAEADDQQVNLTRFALFFPEKRDFFLENAGQFNVGAVPGPRRLADLFFSRRIGLSDSGDGVPIIGGARLSGRLGRNSVALMDVQTDDAFGLNGENFLIARYSRDVLGRSKVGALVVNKEETGGSHYNRTVAADMTLAPHDALTLTGFVAKTSTPGLTGGDMGSYLNATWLDTSWRIFGEFLDFDEDFNPEVGFVPRRGIRSTKLHLERTPRPGRYGVRMLSPMINWTYLTDQQGRLLSKRWHYMMGTRFDNGAYLNFWYNHHFERLDDPFSLQGMATVQPGDYEYGEWRFSFDSNPSRRVYYGAMYSPQDFFDGTRKDSMLKMGLRLSSQLSTEAQYNRNDIDLPGGAFVINLASIRIDYALSPTMTLRSLTQFNSSTDQFSTSARFRYTYRPGSDIYLVYDELRRDPIGLTQYRDRRLLLKVAHLLSR